MRTHGCRPKQKPFHIGKGACTSVALSSSSRAAGFGTLLIELRVSSSKFKVDRFAPSTRHSSLVAFNSFQGCRGFIGPVPPPLWIRAAYSIVAGNDKRVTLDCQVGSWHRWPSHPTSRLPQWRGDGLGNPPRLIGCALAGIIRRTEICTQPEDRPCHLPNAAGPPHSHAARTAR